MFLLSIYIPCFIKKITLSFIEYLFSIKKFSLFFLNIEILENYEEVWYFMVVCNLICVPSISLMGEYFFYLSIFTNKNHSFYSDVFLLFSSYDFGHHFVFYRNTHLLTLLDPVSSHPSVDCS